METNKQNRTLSPVIREILFNYKVSMESQSKSGGNPSKSGIKTRKKKKCNKNAKNVWVRRNFSTF